MILNPFKYTAPLSPVRDRLICDVREDDVTEILSNIFSGEYLAILGPRKVGKTTLLNLLQDRQPEVYYIYVSIDAFGKITEVGFYKYLMKKLLATVPMKEYVQIPDDDWKTMGPSFAFLDFLRQSLPKEPAKKIVFLLDEVDKLPYCQSFLSLWRQVYHERYECDHLRTYSVVVTGTMDLISLTSDSPNSPFNIAETLYVKDFSTDVSRRLLLDTFNQLGVSIKENALEWLLKWLEGHPQLLQHAGSILTDGMGKHTVLDKAAVDSAIQKLMEENFCLERLRGDVVSNEPLANLLRSMLIDGRKRRIFRFRKLVLYGAGAIIEKDGFCSVRNELYEIIIREQLETSSILEEKTELQSEGSND